MRTSTPLHLSLATWGLHWTTGHCGKERPRRKETSRREWRDYWRVGEGEREEKRETKRGTSRTNRPKTKYQLDLNECVCKRETKRRRGFLCRALTACQHTDRATTHHIIFKHLQLIMLQAAGHLQHAASVYCNDFVRLTICNFNRENLVIQKLYSQLHH